jgi:hypothetical protein
MYLRAIASTLKSRRFWVWQLGGAVIYGVPAAVRLVTGSVYLPVLGLFLVPWIDHYVPGNLVEKVLVPLLEKFFMQMFMANLLREGRSIWLGLAAHCCRRLRGLFFSFGETCKT